MFAPAPAAVPKPPAKPPIIHDFPNSPASNFFSSSQATVIKFPAAPDIIPPAA